MLNSAFGFSMRMSYRPIERLDSTFLKTEMELDFAADTIEVDLGSKKYTAVVISSLNSKDSIAVSVELDILNILGTEYGDTKASRFWYLGEENEKLKFEIMKGLDGEKSSIKFEKSKILGFSCSSKNRQANWFMISVYAAAIAIGVASFVYKY